MKDQKGNLIENTVIIACVREKIKFNEFTIHHSKISLENTYRVFSKRVSITT